MNIYYVIMNALDTSGSLTLKDVNEQCFSSIADKRLLFDAFKGMAMEGWVTYDLAKSQFSITDKGKEYVKMCQEFPIDMLTDYRNIKKHKKNVQDLQDHLGISNQNDEDTTIIMAINHIIRQEMTYGILKYTIDKIVAQCYNEPNIDMYDGLKRMVAEILFHRKKK